MATVCDGPHSPLFTPLPLFGNIDLAQLAGSGVSTQMAGALPPAPVGDCVCWGIPFHSERPVLPSEIPVELNFTPVTAPWLVFQHTSDLRPLAFDDHVAHHE